jgi:predicted enzyme related to lactoylglutathione lyase
MHRSKLAGFIIDCNTGDLDAAAEFWSAALGLAVTSDGDAEAGYRHLASGPGGLHIEVQQVSHPSRVHLDIESDDIDAEVRRLEKLGARRIEAIKRWVVMEAPTGQRFCVVRAQTPRFDLDANEWSE